MQRRSARLVSSIFIVLLAFIASRAAWGGGFGPSQGAGIPSSLPPSGAAGGDLGGTYPNPTVGSVAHVTVGTLPVANGGSGVASYTIGDILYASASTTQSKLADVATGSVLVSGGVATAPAYSTTPTVTSLTATSTLNATQSITLNGATPVANAIALGTGDGNTSQIIGPTNATFNIRAGLNSTTGQGIGISGANGSGGSGVGGAATVAGGAGNGGTTTGIGAQLNAGAGLVAGGGGPATLSAGSTQALGTGNAGLMTVSGGTAAGTDKSTDGLALSTGNTTGTAGGASSIPKIVFQAPSTVTGSSASANTLNTIAQFSRTGTLAAGSVYSFVQNATGNALATTAVDGFPYIASCAGTPTGTPTSFTGAAPLCVDSSNNKLYFYSGGAWVLSASGGTPTGSAGGDLGGTYPNPTVTSIANVSAGTLGVARGGTNLTSYAVGDILYASGTTTIAKLADVATGSVLVSGGVTTAPAYSTTPTVTSLTATSSLSAGQSGTTGTLNVYGTTSGHMVITVPAIAGTPTYTFPAAVGASGTYLKDAAGNGVLSWATAAGSASSLTATLAVGNTTSGLNIDMTSGDSIEPAADAGNILLGSNAKSVSTIFVGSGSSNAGANVLNEILIQGTTSTNASSAPGRLHVVGSTGGGAQNGAEVRITGGLSGTSTSTGGVLNFEVGGAGTSSGTAGAIRFLTGPAGTGTGTAVTFECKDGGNFCLSNSRVYGWSGSLAPTGTAPDTGLSRGAAGLVDFGTGANGSTAGSWSATNGTLAGQLAWTTGAGAINQLLGPADQDYLIQAGQTASTFGRAIIMTGGNGISNNNGGVCWTIAGNGNGSGDGGAWKGLGGTAGSTGNGGAAQVLGGPGVAGNGGLTSAVGGAGVGSDKSSGGLLLGTGISTGLGASNVKIQTSFTGTTGSTAQTNGDRLFVSGKSLVLSNTTATATAFASLSTTSGSAVGGTAYYTVEGTDGTEWGIASGSIEFGAVNKAGTLTVANSVVPSESLAGTGTFTITGTPTAVASGTAILLKVTPTIVGTATKVRVSWTLVVHGLTTVTPQ